MNALSVLDQPLTFITWSGTRYLLELDADNEGRLTRLSESPISGGPVDPIWRAPVSFDQPPVLGGRFRCEFLNPFLGEDKRRMLTTSPVTELIPWSDFPQGA